MQVLDYYDRGKKASGDEAARSWLYIIFLVTNALGLLAAICLLALSISYDAYARLASRYLDIYFLILQVPNSLGGAIVHFTTFGANPRRLLIWCSILATLIAITAYWLSQTLPHDGGVW